MMRKTPSARRVWARDTVSLRGASEMNWTVFLETFLHSNPAICGVAAEACSLQRPTRVDSALDSLSFCSPRAGLGEAMSAQDGTVPRYRNYGGEEGEDTQCQNRPRPVRVRQTGDERGQNTAPRWDWHDMNSPGLRCTWESAHVPCTHSLLWLHLCL